MCFYVHRTNTLSQWGKWMFQKHTHTGTDWVLLRLSQLSNVMILWFKYSEYLLVACFESCSKPLNVNWLSVKLLLHQDTNTTLWWTFLENKQPVPTDSFLSIVSWTCHHWPRGLFSLGYKDISHVSKILETYIAFEPECPCF